MKNAFAKFLLVLFLFSALVPAQAKEELAKLPDLLEHYKAHKLEDPSIGFLAFYKMHYGADFAQHQTDHDHSGLPMKHHCDHVHAPALALLPQQCFNPSISLVSINGNQPVFIDQSYSFSLPNDIWQPPRA